jgi:hypothetical protein
MNALLTERSRAALMRATAFFALWLVLAGVDPVDMPMGALAAIAATRKSLRPRARVLRNGRAQVHGDIGLSPHSVHEHTGDASSWHPAGRRGPS